MRIEVGFLARTWGWAEWNEEKGEVVYGGPKVDLVIDAVFRYLGLDPTEEVLATLPNLMHAHQWAREVPDDLF